MRKRAEVDRRFRRLIIPQWAERGVRMLRSLRTAATGLCAATFLSGAAHAAEVVDQSQLLLDVTAGYLGIGGGSEQKLAQTFTAGVTGNLVAIRMPVVGCGGGELVMEVRLAAADGTPDGTLLSTTRYGPATVPPSGADFHEFRLGEPLRIRRSVKYAYTLRMDPTALTSNCSYAKSATGDPYAGGEHYFDTRPNPPGWLAASEVPDPAKDLAFETIVDTGSGPGPGAGSGDCFIPTPGGGGAPIPGSAPVCRCLQDEGLREFRCALLHPDFFAIRRIPWPIPLNASYAESWEVLPLTRLKDQIRIELKGANLAQPVTLTFSGKSLKAVELRKASFKAPASAGELPGTAVIMYGNQSFALDRSIPAEGFGPGGFGQKTIDGKQLP
jgi:hypothetical protein